MPPMFQHTAARRRLGMLLAGTPTLQAVSTHSRPKAAGVVYNDFNTYITVSTHSRPKAAGIGRFRRSAVRRRFNTQPPEGGWTKHQVNQTN